MADLEKTEEEHPVDLTGLTVENVADLQDALARQAVRRILARIDADTLPVAAFQSAL